MLRTCSFASVDVIVASAGDRDGRRDSASSRPAASRPGPACPPSPWRSAAGPRRRARGPAPCSPRARDRATARQLGEGGSRRAGRRDDEGDADLPKHGVGRPDHRHLRRPRATSPSTASTSAGYTLYPPRMYISETRPARRRLPSAPEPAESPVVIQPSASSTAPVALRVEQHARWRGHPHSRASPPPSAGAPGRPLRVPPRRRVRRRGRARPRARADPRSWPPPRRDPRARCRSRATIRSRCSAPRRDSRDAPRMARTSSGGHAPPPVPAIRRWERSAPSRSAWASIRAHCVGTPWPTVMRSETRSSIADRRGPRVRRDDRGDPVGDLVPGAGHVADVGEGQGRQPPVPRVRQHVGARPPRPGGWRGRTPPPWGHPSSRSSTPWPPGRRLSSAAPWPAWGGPAPRPGHGAPAPSRTPAAPSAVATRSVSTTVTTGCTPGRDRRLLGGPQARGSPRVVTAPRRAAAW